MATRDPVYERIRAAAAREALSHALLFTGPGPRLEAARFAAAAMECAARPEGRPCGLCPACKKVEKDIHPDVITVLDPDHKTEISVDVIREVRKDAYIQPNEGRRKVYIFPDCGLLTVQDQNVLLKLVEEGPPYASFLFCAENPAGVLQTLRSRCVELRVRPDGEERAVPEDWNKLGRTIAGGRRGDLALLAADLEVRNVSREDLGAMLERCRAVFAGGLLRCYGGPPQDPPLPDWLPKDLSPRQLMGLVELLGRYVRDCGYNVSPGHLLGGLAAELEGFL